MHRSEEVDDQARDKIRVTGSKKLVMVSVYVGLVYCYYYS